MTGIFVISNTLASKVEVPVEILDKSKTDLLRQGESYLRRNRLDSAFIIFTTIVSYNNIDRKLSPEDTKAIINAYIHLASIHHNHNSATSKYLNYAKAYRYYTQAVALGEKHGFDSELAEAYLGLGVLYSTMSYAYEDKSMSDTIYHLYKRSLENALLNDRHDVQDKAAKNLAVEAFLLDSMTSVSPLLTKYFKHSASGRKNDSDAMINVAYCKALQAVGNKNAEKALQEIDSMLAYAKDNPVSLIDAYSLRAEVLYSFKKDTKGTLAMIDSTQGQAKKVDDLWINMQVLNNKATILRQLNLSSQADACLSEVNTLRKKMLNEGSVGEIKDLHFTNQIEDLNAELTRMTLERTYTRRILTVVGIALAIIFVMLLIILKAYRNLKESQKHIFEEYTRRQKEENENELKPSPDIRIKDFMIDDDEEDESDISEDAATTGEEDEGSRRYSGRQLTEEEKDAILRRIRRVLGNNEKIFMSRFQIKDLAAETGISFRLISQVINEKLNCNFASILAEYRIKAVCRRISDSPEFRKLTIEAMSESVGFQSRSYFSTTFKKVTGLTPSTFIRQATLADIKKQ